ncbi:MAG TPA: cytochrome c oxidase subunit III [Spongiibacteraceae bacterium]|nr:cytochrome c oxidase subunit III [Spongiibacteraceae bacterium]HCS27135.1 cytochrome c oxidase subunit III [Spongiibacteraceae bacterium]|tara:strand:+ start:227 stop:904 length:678 start_codon:yes stop_codon:yes gene_type:complete
MSFFGTLSEKPWLTPSAIAHGPVSDVAPYVAARTALNFIMGIVSVLFFLFFITLLSRSQYPDFQALAGQPWQPFTDTSRLWFNTGLLLLSSAAMQFGLMSARRQQAARMIAGLGFATAFAIVFLLAQLQLWQQLNALGFYVGSNPANSYFYLLTAVHGLHLLGGLVALGHIARRLWQRAAPEILAMPLSLCARYWHFLLLVWLVVFALLTSEPATINALAAMCGF